MSERTGLGPLEVALLRTVETLTDDTPVHTTAALDMMENIEHFGAAYAVRAMQHLGAPWCVHLQLLDLRGNWGSAAGDPMADPAYTEVGLSAVGRLALAAERGQVGPAPIGLVNGSAYRGGRVPPLNAARALGLLRRLTVGDPLGSAALDDLVSLPTSGIVTGDLDALYDGRAARVTMSCRIERDHGADGPLLVITGTPIGVGSDEVMQELESRVQRARRVRPTRQYAGFDSDWVDPSRAPETVTNVRDETTRDRVRIVVEVAAEAGDAGLDEAEYWLRGLWPVTVEADWQIPGGLAASLRPWVERCRADRSGLDALYDLVN